VGNDRSGLGVSQAMEPNEFRSSFRSRLFDLGERRPTNLDDVILFPERKGRTRSSVQSAGRKNGEARELVFPSGSKLRFLVSFGKDEKGWQVTGYSFHLSRGERWFRYDLDPDAADGQRHPLAHLHVGADEPRYPTKEIDPLELLDFLIRQQLV
jgi:hypothetical protein